MACHLPSERLCCPQRLQLAVHRLGPRPLLELDRSQAVAQPLVPSQPDPGRLRRFPAQHTGPELLHHLLHAAPATAAGGLPDSGFEVAQWLYCHLAFDLLALGYPQRITQDFAPEGARHRTLSFIDLKRQAVVQPPEQPHHPFACLSVTHISVAIIGGVRKAVARTSDTLSTLSSSTPDHSSILDSLSHSVSRNVVVNPLKELGEDLHPPLRVCPIERSIARP